MSKSGLFTRGALGLGALAATSLYNIWKGGQRAGDLLQADKDLPMGFTMRRRAPAMKIAGRRRSFRRVTTSRSTAFRSMKRSSGLIGIANIAAGTSSIGFNRDITLDFVQHSDLSSFYKLYRIKKVQVKIWPQISPNVNQGAIIATNTEVQQQATVHVACDCDGRATVATQGVQIGAYPDHYAKPLTGTKDVLTYTFYPKVQGTVLGSGGAVNTGNFARNPWLSFSDTSIPHKQLVGFIQTQGNQPAGKIQSYSCMYTIWFDVRT